MGEGNNGREANGGGALTAASPFRSVLTLAELDGPDPFVKVFGRRAPLEIEIGTGKGRFLIRCATAMTETDFLGVERSGRFFRLAAARADRHGLANLRLIRADGAWLLAHHVPEGSVRALHVLFPDPWPKKRHHKRRLFGPRFAESVERVLAAGGTLNVATDHDGYFAVIEECLRGRGPLERLPDFVPGDRLPIGELGLTNYEVKYRAGGRAIHRASWRRRPRPSP